jgi:aminodeoxyfutalosine synthase
MTSGGGAIDALAGRVAAGGALSDDDAQLVLDTKDLIGVGVLADDLRRHLHGARTTFGRVFEVHVDAVPGALPAGISAGEIRIVGTPLSVEAAVAAVAGVSKLGRAASIPVTGFSLADLQALSSPLDRVCESLRAAGLDGVAEVPVDATEDAAAAIAEVRAAGLHVLRLTVNDLELTARVALAARARDIQDAVGGLRAFAPLPRLASPASPSTGYDDVKLVAAARLLVTNIPSIQVDWMLYGPKLAQVSLTMGADDVDAVSALDGGELGTRRSPLEEIRANIRAAGQEPVERNGLFGPAAR